MIIAINYANEVFKKQQKYNTKTAYKKGKVDIVIEYGPEKLDDDFKRRYEHILSQKRGGGYWLWKPYIILKTLQNANYGDYIIYCDSGAYYVNKVEKMVDTMKKNNLEIMAFELPLIEGQWTKRETLDLMDCSSEKYAETNQILATYFIFTKSKYTETFFNKYFKLCTDERLLTDLKDENNQSPWFKDHRHDQSIFSLLCKKEGIQPYRDPSQYGDKPWQYFDFDRYILLKKYDNSTYPRTIMLYRKSNITKFKVVEFIKDILLSFKFIKIKFIV